MFLCGNQWMLSKLKTLKHYLKKSGVLFLSESAKFKSTKD